MKLGTLFLFTILILGMVSYYNSDLNSHSFAESSLNTPLLTAFADSDDDAMDDASGAIADANKEIEKADKKIAKAADKGKDTLLSEEKLSEARELLAMAEASFDDGNYDDAEDLAEEAKDLASESRGKLIGKTQEDLEVEEELDDNSDDEFEIEIEVEIENGIAKIEVEFGDEELEFEMKWVDKQTTVDEISLRTGLSLDQIDASISFEFEDDVKKTKQEKLAEKQARFAEKLAEKEAKPTEKAQLSEERAYKIIQKLEQKIYKLEQRLQQLLDKYQSGEYFGNIKNLDSETNSYTLSFDGIASEIGDSSNEQSVNGKLFLENQVTGNHIKKFRVFGGEIFVGESDVYDIVFGKARLTSSGQGGEKNSMIVIAQVSNGVDVRTLKLSISLSESFDKDTELVDIEILSPRSKIASEWFLSGIGTLGLTESDAIISQDETTDETVEPDVTIPDADIPVTTQISVSTSEPSYLTGDTIIISGMIDKIFENTPVILQLISTVDLIEIAQIDVESDGAYTHTVIAQGSQWVSDGTYTVKVFYGANNVAETSFEFTS